MNSEAIQDGLFAIGPDDLSVLVFRLREAGHDNERVEVKACAGGLGKSVWDSVSSFANTEGGLLVLGLDEEAGFTPASGFDARRVVDQFVTGIGDGGQPALLENVPEYRIAHGLVDGGVVLLVTIVENPPGHKPCFVKAKGMVGGAFKRRSDKNIRLSPTEIFELQHTMEVSAAEAGIVEDARVEDLDDTLLDRLIARKSGGKSLRGVTAFDQQLRRLNITSRDGQVRLVGLLAAGVYPQQFFPRLFVDVAVHPGLEKSEPGSPTRFFDRVRCEGNLVDMIDEAVAVTARNLRTYSVVVGAGRSDELEIPREVLREAVANALVHRQYHELFCGEPVTVDIYPDRVVIANPGGLWGGKTLDNLDDGTSRCRNQALIQLLVDLPGADSTFRVEGQGGGVSLMINKMRARALSVPVFRAEPDRVSVTLMRHGAEIPAERAWLRSLARRDLTPHEDAALLLARRRGAVTVSLLRTELRLDSDDGRRVLGALERAGLLDRAAHERFVLSGLTEGMRPAERDVFAVLSDHPVSIHELSALTGKSANALRPILRGLVARGLAMPTAGAQSRLRRYRRGSGELPPGGSASADQPEPGGQEPDEPGGIPRYSDE